MGSRLSLSVSIMHGLYPCTFSVSSVDYSLCLLFLVRSEGPAQVFLLVLTWLAAAFGNLARADGKKIILSYDNMCHLDNLKVAKRPLPLPGM